MPDDYRAIEAAAWAILRSLAADRTLDGSLVTGDTREAILRGRYNVMEAARAAIAAYERAKEQTGTGQCPECKGFPGNPIYCLVPECPLRAELLALSR